MSKNRILQRDIKQVRQPPYIIKPDEIHKYDLKNLIFNRVVTDPNWPGHQRMIDERVPEMLKDPQPGYTHVDFALEEAAWTLHDTFEGSFARSRIPKYRKPKAEIDHDLSTIPYKVENPSRMSIYVKRAAQLFGASLTGICQLNLNWLYADTEIPRNCNTAIVMAIEMDPEGIATSPAIPASSATGVGYSRMGFVLALLGEFIRNLGYDAIQCGNDSGISIPLAIDAGLGQLGRHGLLITPQFGSRVRLCKIFTNLPLRPDSPIDFGVTETCRRCKRCAEACEVDAISFDDEPTFTPKCSSNNAGALKWYVDSEVCYEFWCNNGGDCSTCISVCPYTKNTFDKVPLQPEEFWTLKTQHNGMLI
ncbi:MAG: reductive dehalogenase [Promethearchaeota archaeon]